MRVLFEIRRFNKENVIFINNQLFDWKIDDKALDQIKKIKDNEKIKLINESIKKYFLDSLNYFVGKQLTLKEVLESIKSGYLDI